MVKRLFRVALVLVLMCGSAFSQVFEEGRSFISAGYGVGNLGLAVLKAVSAFDTDYKVSAVGPLFLKYEYAISDKIGIGLNLALVTAKATYTYRTITLSNGQPYEEYLDYTSYSALVRFNFHFAEHDKLDPYIGLGMGYRGASWKWSDNDPNDTITGGDITIKSIFPLGYELTLGSRFMFSENIGAYAEVGFAKAVFQGGLVVAF